MTQTPTLSQFYDRLKAHDWHYSYSDDHSVYRRGQSAQDRLVSDAAKFGPAYAEMFSAFSKHHFSGKPWGTEQSPLPERPGDAA